MVQVLLEVANLDPPVIMITLPENNHYLRNLFYILLSSLFFEYIMVTQYFPVTVRSARYARTYVLMRPQPLRSLEFNEVNKHMNNSFQHHVVQKANHAWRSPRNFPI